MTTANDMAVPEANPQQGVLHQAIAVDDFEDLPLHAAR